MEADGDGALRMTQCSPAATDPGLPHPLRHGRHTLTPPRSESYVAACILVIPPSSKPRVDQPLARAPFSTRRETSISNSITDDNALLGHDANPSARAAPPPRYASYRWRCALGRDLIRRCAWRRPYASLPMAENCGARLGHPPRRHHTPDVPDLRNHQRCHLRRAPFLQ